ncbi:MAG: hypothetical protein WDZ35_15025 [Crocinitomicaceae bacterium]
MNIFQAIDTGDAEKIRQSLRENPDQLNTKNKKGMNPVEYGKNKGSSEIIMILEGAMIAASKGVY